MLETNGPDEQQPPGPPQSISPEERSFLTKLSQSVKNTTLSDHIDSIIETLDNSPNLHRADYDFLIKLSEHIKNEKISGILEQIAEKHRPQ